MPEFNVSRRKVLAGLGTIGIASAGAGLGTTAFFSDEESLQGSLEAGRIDLKLDYRSTYVPWDRQTTFDSIGTIPGTDMNDDGVDDRYVLDETPNVTYSEDAAAGREDVAAGDLLTEDDWGTLTNSIGCDGSVDQYDLVDGDAGVVVDLEDIKPKDEGEFTVSLHVCDNRAYLWMQTETTLDSDNGVVEPEAQAGTGAWDASAPDDGTDDGDLDDFTYVQAWYDTNCNNVRDGGEPVDVAILFDTSGSMNETTPGAGLNDAPEKLESVKQAVVDLSTFLTTDSRVTVYSFDSDYQREYDLASPDPSAIESAIAGATADGGTVYSDVVEAAANYLDTAPAARADARKIMVFLSDGGPKNEVADTGTGTNSSPTDGTTDEDRAAALAAVSNVTSGADPLVDDLYTIAYETADDSNASGLLEDMATSEDFAFTAGEEGVELTFREIGRSIRGDVLLYQGSLAGFLALGASGVSLDPGQDEDFVVAQQGSAEACVDPGVTCLALDWYLPCFYEQDDGLGFSQLPSSRPGVADQDGDGDVTLADELIQLRGHSQADLEAFDAINLAQTDGVDFTLRFAAVQCRHNAANRNPYTSPSTVENVTGEGFGKAELLGEPGASGKIIQGNQGNFTAAVGGADFDSGGDANREVGTTTTPPGDGTAIPFSYTWDPDAGANGTYTLSWDYGGGVQTAVYGDDAVEQPNVNGPGTVVGITVRGSEDDGTAAVSNLRLETDAVDETVGPVASGDTIRYSAFAGVPDLADGFTLSGDLALNFPPSPRGSGEIPGMYLYVGE